MLRPLLLLLALVLASMPQWAASIAVVPKSAGKVSASRDSNIVLIEGDWRKIDFAKMFQNGRPHPPVDDKHLRSDTRIMVLVAALRETRLAKTVHSFFANASYPERVFIGIVQQNEASDTDIIQEYCALVGTPVHFKLNPDRTADVSPVDDNKPCVRAKQIRVMRLLQSEAHGPAYARGLGSDLVDAADDFCMQIDAHTLVVKEWDTLMLKEWGAAENEYAVLSTYPSNVHHLGININNHWEMPHLCCVSGTRGIIVNCQAKALAGMDRPVLSPFWAAGLSFSKCHAERLVPNDRNLKGVFAGEEYGRGVRLWTHGYDFYSISRPLVGTYYGNEKGGRGGWRTPHKDMERSHARLATLVRADGADTSPEAVAALGMFALGKRRTLEQYIEFTGIDPRHNGPHNAHCAVVYQPWDDGAPRVNAAASADASELHAGAHDKETLDKVQNARRDAAQPAAAVTAAAAAATHPLDANADGPRLKMRGRRVGPGSGFVVPPSPHETRDPSVLFLVVPVLAVAAVLAGVCNARSPLAHGSGAAAALAATSAARRAKRAKN